MFAARRFVVAACLAALTVPAAGFAQRASGTPRPPAPSDRVTVPPWLATELKPMLHGLNAETAARGFRSLGDFVTVLHLAANLEIPFPTLKKRVVTERIPLDIAVRRMRPGVDVKKEIARAEEAADELLGKGPSPDVFVYHSPVLGPYDLRAPGPDRPAESCPAPMAVDAGPSGADGTAAHRAHRTLR